MTNLIVIQARTNSSRLPGKVLLPINSIPIVVLAAKRAGKYFSLTNAGRKIMGPVSGGVIGGGIGEAIVTDEYNDKQLINIIGFEPPKGDSKHVSPLGNDNAQMPAINISEGFNLGFCRCKPGKGPLMHNHDTNETFMPITGKWRCEWNEGDDLIIF